MRNNQTHRRRLIMKTITMDWDTYQKEIGSADERYQQGFEDGAKEADTRLKPILDWIREVIQEDPPDYDGTPEERSRRVDEYANQIKKLMEEAGEL